MHGDHIKNTEYDYAIGLTWKERIWPVLDLQWENLTFDEIKQLQNDHKKNSEHDQGVLPAKAWEPEKKIDDAIEVEAPSVKSSEPERKIVGFQETEVLKEKTKTVFIKKDEEAPAEQAELWSFLADEIIRNAVQEVASEREPDMIKDRTQHAVTPERVLPYAATAVTKDVNTVPKKVEGKANDVFLDVYSTESEGFVEQDSENVELLKNADNDSITISNNCVTYNDKKKESYENARNLMEVILQEHEEARKKAIGIAGSNNSNDGSPPDIVSGRYFLGEKEESTLINKNYEENIPSQTESHLQMLRSLETSSKKENDSAALQLGVFENQLHENSSAIEQDSRSQEALKTNETKDDFNDNKTELRSLLDEVINDLIENIEDQERVMKSCVLSENFKIGKRSMNSENEGMAKHTGKETTTERQNKVSSNKQENDKKSIVEQIGDIKDTEQADIQKTPTAAIEALLEEMEKLHDLSEERHVTEKNDPSEEEIGQKIGPDHSNYFDGASAKTLSKLFNTELNDPATNDQPIKQVADESEKKQHTGIENSAFTASTVNAKVIGADDAPEHPCCDKINDINVINMHPSAQDILFEVISEITAEVEKNINATYIPVTTNNCFYDDKHSSADIRNNSKGEEVSPFNDPSSPVTNESDGDVQNCFELRSDEKHEDNNGFELDTGVLNCVDYNKDDVTAENMSSQKAFTTVVKVDKSEEPIYHNTVSKKSQKDLTEVGMAEAAEPMLNRQQGITKDGINKPLHKNLSVETPEKNKSHEKQTSGFEESVLQDSQDKLAYNASVFSDTTEAVKAEGNAGTVFRETNEEEVANFFEKRSDIVQERDNKCNDMQGSPGEQQTQSTTVASHTLGNVGLDTVSERDVNKLKAPQKLGNHSEMPILRTLTDLEADTDKNHDVLFRKENEELTDVPSYKSGDDNEDSSFSAELTEQAECCASFDSPEIIASQNSSDFFNAKKRINNTSFRAEQDLMPSINSSSPSGLNHSKEEGSISGSLLENEKKEYLERLIAENQALFSKMPKSPDYFGSESNRLLNEEEMYGQTESFSSMGQLSQIRSNAYAGTQPVGNFQKTSLSYESGNKKLEDNEVPAGESKPFYKRPHKRGRGHFKAPFFDYDLNGDSEKPQNGETSYSDGRGRRRKSKRGGRGN